MATYLTGRYARIGFKSLQAAYLLMRHTDKTLHAEPKSIVVIQTAQLGDMVCTTPVFRAIKKHLPHSRVIVVGTAAARGILANNPDVDTYIAFDEQNPTVTARALAAERADAGVLAVPSLDGILLLANARIPFIVAPQLVGGWSPSNTRLYRFLRSFVRSARHTYGAYAAREYLRLLEPLGIVEDDTTKHLAYTREAFARVESLLHDAGIRTDDAFVCIAPGAGNKVKQWPSERFAAVADYVSKSAHCSVVILGSAADQHEVEIMRTALSSETNYVDMCGALSLDEVKAVISKAKLLIAADTMAIYIAEAFDVAIVDIVGPVDPNEQPPHGPKWLVVTPPGTYVPELHTLNARVYNIAEATRQATSTTIEQVIDAVAKLLPCE